MGEAVKHLQPVPDKQSPLAHSAEKEMRPVKRPATRQWRIDLKWVFGIPFTFFLIVALFVFALFTISSRERATRTIAAMDSRIVADAQLMADLSRSNPRLAALLVQPDFATLVYENPNLLDEAAQADQDSRAAAAAAIPEGASSDEVQAAQEEQAQAAGRAQGAGVMLLPLKMMGAPVHETLGAVLTVLAALMLLTGIPFLLLSRRAGRLVSPAVSLALASWLPLLVIGGIDGSATRWIETRQAEALGGGEEERMVGLIADVFRPFLENIFSGALGVYRAAAIASAALLLAAVAIKAVLKVNARRGRPAGGAAPGGQEFRQPEATGARIQPAGR